MERTEWKLTLAPAGDVRIAVVTIVAAARVARERVKAIAVLALADHALYILAAVIAAFAVGRQTLCDRARNRGEGEPPRIRLPAFPCRPSPVRR
jgi:hypothetical protein